MKKLSIVLVGITSLFLIVLVTVFALLTTDIAINNKQFSEYQTTAQTNIAKMYLTGELVKKDEKQAAEWFQLAAATGNAEAQTQLALLYASGTGVEEDFAQAIVLLGKAAKQDHGQALDLLHWMTQAAH